MASSQKMYQEAQRLRQLADGKDELTEAARLQERAQALKSSGRKKVRAAKSSKFFSVMGQVFFHIVFWPGLMLFVGHVLSR